MSTLVVLRLLERLHGHLAWLAVAGLLHPALLLRNPRRRAPLAVGLTTGLVAVAASLGAWVYPEYRARLKQHLFLEAPRLGWMFERKEHLAVGVVAFALVGCVAHLAVPWCEPGDTRLVVARLAQRAFAVAFALGVAVGVLGVAVASYKSF